MRLMVLRRSSLKYPNRKFNISNILQQLYSGKFNPFIHTLSNLSVVFFAKWVFVLFVIVSSSSELFAQKTVVDTETTADLIKKKQPIAAYWIKNLFFTRGLNIREELWDLKGNGAFRSRWRFIYSNPLGPRFSLQLEVPFALVVSSVAKSVAGLGDVNILFQGAVTHNKLWKQIAGLGIYLPTGSHVLLGGNLTTINPRYQIDYIGYKYAFPCFLTRYFHSVFEEKDAPRIRVLTLEPFVTFPQIASESIGLSASLELEWNFNFVSDRSGGLIYIGLSKQMNPQTVLHIELSPGITNYSRNALWEWRYNADVLMTF